MEILRPARPGRSRPPGSPCPSFRCCMSRVCPASQRLREAIVEQRIVPPPYRTLAPQAARAIARSGRRGWRIDKARPQRPRRRPARVPLIARTARRPTAACPVARLAQGKPVTVGFPPPAPPAASSSRPLRWNSGRARACADSPSPATASDAPRCRGWAELPDGTFDVALYETIRVLSASKLTRERLERLRNILVHAQMSAMPSRGGRRGHRRRGPLPATYLSIASARGCGPL